MRANPFFNNAYPYDCPIIECQMFSKGCKNQKLSNSRVSLKPVNKEYTFEIV